MLHAAEPCVKVLSQLIKRCFFIATSLVVCVFMCVSCVCVRETAHAHLNRDGKRGEILRDCGAGSGKERLFSAATSLHVALLTYPRRPARRQLPVAKSPGVRRTHAPARLILRTSAHLMSTSSDLVHVVAVPAAAMGVLERLLEELVLSLSHSGILGLPRHAMHEQLSGDR